MEVVNIPYMDGMGYIEVNFPVLKQGLAAWLGNIPDHNTRTFGPDHNDNNDNHVIM